MAGPFFSCDVNYLIGQSKCFMEWCMGDQTREAIEIYLGVQNLKASGGTDYTSNLNQLLKDSKVFQVLSQNQRRSIGMWIDMQNAIDNGATFSQDVNSLASGAKCYECLGEELRKNILLYLKCAINTLGKADGSAV